MHFKIRPATSQDLIHIQTIYNHEVSHGLANWNDQAFDLAHFQHWFAQLQQQQFPLFVIEDTTQNSIAGYADYSSFRQIAGFRHTVEHSVFIDPSYARLGLGMQLLEHLIAHAKAQHVHVMVAAIDHENLASIKLHEKLGFKHTGYLPQVGQKFGQWRDLVLMQLNFEHVEAEA